MTNVIKYLNKKSYTFIWAGLLLMGNQCEENGARTNDVGRNRLNVEKNRFRGGFRCSGDSIYTKDGYKTCSKDDFRPHALQGRPILKPDGSATGLLFTVDSSNPAVLSVSRDSSICEDGVHQFQQYKDIKTSFEGGLEREEEDDGCSHDISNCWLHVELTNENQISVRLAADIDGQKVELFDLTGVVTTPLIGWPESLTERRCE